MSDDYGILTHTGNKVVRASVNCSKPLRWLSFSSFGTLGNASLAELACGLLRHCAKSKWRLVNVERTNVHGFISVESVDADVHQLTGGSDLMIALLLFCAMRATNRPLCFCKETWLNLAVSLTLPGSIGAWRLLQRLLLSKGLAKHVEPMQTTVIIDKELQQVLNKEFRLDGAGAS